MCASSKYMFMTLYIVRTKFKHGLIITCFERFHIAVNIPAPQEYILNTCCTTPIEQLMSGDPDTSVDYDRAIIQNSH